VLNPIEQRYIKGDKVYVIYKNGTVTHGNEVILEEGGLEKLKEWLKDNTYVFVKAGGETFRVYENDTVTNKDGTEIFL